MLRAALLLAMILTPAAATTAVANHRIEPRSSEEPPVPSGPCAGPARYAPSHLAEAAMWTDGRRVEAQAGVAGTGVAAACHVPRVTPVLPPLPLLGQERERPHLV